MYLQGEGGWGWGPAWNDVGVGDTGQPLEAVALVVFSCHLDEEALGGSAELRETPQSLLAEVRGQRHGDGAQGATRARHELHMAELTWRLQASAFQQNMGWKS